MLTLCFEETVLQELCQLALKCLNQLYIASPAFVWALMREVGQCYPEGRNIKPSTYFPEISRWVRGFIRDLLTLKN
jgi:hypothetical protein